MGAGSVDGERDRVVALYERDGAVEVVIRAFAADDAAPEGAFAFIAGVAREDDGERDFAFTEVIAGIFAHGVAGAAVIESIIDELEGEAEFTAIGVERRRFGAWATSEAYAVSLDLDTRKMIPITGEARERMLERVTPGLAL